MSVNMHTHHSSYREMVLEHVFVGEILRNCWKQGRPLVEILKSQVDASGYDLVLDAGGITRHVQLKASHVGSHTPQVPINIELGRKPSGCVVWMYFEPQSMEFDHFLWFGSAPGSPLPELEDFRIATHTKRNASGVKTERPNIRLIPKAKFTRVASIDNLVELLFGHPAPAEPVTTTP